MAQAAQLGRHVTIDIYSIAAVSPLVFGSRRTEELYKARRGSLSPGLPLSSTAVIPFLDPGGLIAIALLSIHPATAVHLAVISTNFLRIHTPSPTAKRCTEMVAITRRFALLAALSSIAALSVLPPVVWGGLIRTNDPELSNSIIARHSMRGQQLTPAVEETAASDTDDDNEGHDVGRKANGRKKTSKDHSHSDSSGTKDQPHSKPALQLPTGLSGHATAGAPSAPIESDVKGGQQRHTGSKEHPNGKVRSIPVPRLIPLTLACTSAKHILSILSPA